MESKLFSKPIDLKKMQVTDSFWKREMELVRKEVIPYQWAALNDQIEDAAPSYCMHNFRVASKLVADKMNNPKGHVEPKYTFRGFETLPDDPRNPDQDKFYGFVFQDTDFSKWIESVAYSLSNHPDKELEELADGAIDLVCSAQLENGYLDTYYIINGMDGAFTNLRDHHELYCLGHLVEGAVAYYEATGKDKLYQTACRYADYVADYFGFEEGKCKGYPGHEIAEMALIRLYEVSGNERYKELSKYFIEQRGQKPYYFEEEKTRTKDNPTNEKYHQSHLPVREQEQAVGHAVRAVYLYSGMADNARVYEDQSLYEACQKLWDSIVNRKMYITGGIGATHLGEAFSFDYDLPNDTAYAETCASIGMVFFARRMLEIQADSKYADIMELELYNGVLSGMALDGKSFFYVNPLEVNPKACMEDERKWHVKSKRQKWFGCACCPPNIARLMSSIGSYAVSENDDTLFVHLYMGAEFEKTFVSNGVEAKYQISMESSFPWEGKAKLHIKALDEKNAEGTIALRIPEWTKKEEIKICMDGKELDNLVEKNGYYYITHLFSDSEIILDFPMPVRMLRSNLAVKENAGKLAVKRGPIVFCAEEVDNGKDLHLLHILPKVDLVQVEEVDYLGHQSLELKIPAYRLKEEMEQALYVEYTEGKHEEVELTLVPYYAWNNRGEGEMTVWLSI